MVPIKREEDDRRKEARRKSERESTRIVAKEYVPLLVFYAALVAGSIVYQFLY